MADETNPSGTPLTLDDRLRSLPDDPIPGDLLDRCLATTRPARPRALSWRALRVAAALVLLVGGVAFVVERTRPVDAAEVLKSMKAAWTKVDASHQISRMILPEGERTEETWFLRGKGRRKEVRTGNVLVEVEVNNGRWLFRWDVPSKLVVAWSSEFTRIIGNGPRTSGLVLDREGFVQWAETHRGEIRIEHDTLDGRRAHKVTVNWPAPAASTDTVWFDANSLLPLRQRIEPTYGAAVEITIDYPTPATVNGDLFHFTMPRDVLIEIYDPDLGRQVYSEAPPKGGD